MTRNFLASALIATIAGAGCYTPDLTGVKYTCESANPVCPEGYLCQDGYCIDPFAPMMNGGDMGETMPPKVSGCKAGGFQLTPTVFACPGKFDKNNAANQCNATAGFVVCSKAIEPAALTACDALDGFFVSSVKAWSKWNENAEQAFCADNSPAGKDHEYYAGCGTPKSNPNISKSLSTNADRMCMPFGRALDCWQASDGWDCGDGKGVNSWANTNSTSGVLCCGK